MTDDTPDVKTILRTLNAAIDDARPTGGPISMDGRQRLSNTIDACKNDLDDIDADGLTDVLDYFQSQILNAAGPAEYQVLWTACSAKLREAAMDLEAETAEDEDEEEATEAEEETEELDGLDEASEGE